MDHNKIVDSLRKVEDPNSGVNIIDARLVSDFKLDGNNVFFKLKISKMDPRLKGELNFSCINAIREVYPNAEVHIHMEQADGSSQAHVLPQVKNIIAVASGKGGVGKSTVSVNIAMALKAHGAKVGLIDADVYGPSIPLMLGLKGQRPKIVKLYGQNKIEPIDKDGLSVMSLGFIIEPEQAVVLRGPRLAGVLKQFLHDCIWPELDYLIIDLPPGTGDVQLTLVQSVPVTGAVIVTTPQEVAIADALKAMNMFLLPNINVPIVGIVENMSWFTPVELPENKYYIFGQGGANKLAEKANTIVLGQIPLVQGIRESGDIGNPIVEDLNNPAHQYFVNIAVQLTEQVNLRNTAMDPTKIVEINQ